MLTLLDKFLEFIISALSIHRIVTTGLFIRFMMVDKHSMNDRVLTYAGVLPRSLNVILHITQPWPGKV